MFGLAVLRQTGRSELPPETRLAVTAPLGFRQIRPEVVDPHRSGPDPSGDRVRIDLNKGTADVLISDEELAERRRKLEAEGGYKYPASQTPWQEIQRSVVGQMNTGAILEGAEKYQRIAQTMGLPRDNH